MILSLIFNILISGLLIGCIYYSYMLNKKLSNMQNAKAEMEALIAELNQATGRAEGGVFALKASAKDLGYSLSEKITAAKATLDDLNFILGRADTLANTLTDQVSQGRKPAAAKAESAPVKPASNDFGTFAADEADEDSLANRLKALK